MRKSVSGERLAVSGKDARSSCGPWISAIVRTLLCLLILPLTAHRSPLNALQIQDNSFLIEEAYNQESGVVQHVGTFQRSYSGDWEFGFTQEWPLGGIRHQLSYTIPVANIEGFGTGFGDVALNYRYQLAGNPEARTVAAPRFSVLLPTGDEDEGRGSGAVGFQGNLPLTLVLGDQFVTHWNAGATITPSARNPVGNQAITTGFRLGASAIWLLRPSLNLLVESVWLSEELVVGEGSTVREETAVLSPGVRAAFDVAGGLQIVPGIAYTISLTPNEADDAVFLYLSFEHPFKR